MLHKSLKAVLLTTLFSLLGFLLFINSVTQVNAAKLVPNEIETVDLMNELNPDKQLNYGSINSKKVTPKQQIQTFTDQSTIITPAPDGTNDYATSPDPDYPERDIINAEGQTLHVPEGKIAYVSNAKQFMHAAYGGYNAGRASSNQCSGDQTIPYQNSKADLFMYDTDITKIVFLKDIDLTKFQSDPDIYVYDKSSGRKVKVSFSDSSSFADNPTSSGSTTGTAAGEAYWYFTIKRRPSQEVINKKDYSRLVIDGDGHSIELGKFSLETWNADNGKFNGRINQDLVAKNMNIYGNSWYGIFYTPTGTNETIQTFDNDNYYGSQMAYTAGLVNTYIKNNVNIYSLKTYKGLDGRLYNCEGGGDQQNFQTNNITFESGCVYNGYTYNGNVVELTGGAYLRDGAEVNLYPHGNSAEDAGILNEGILMNGSESTPSLQLYGTAKLNIDCNTQNLRHLIPTISMNDNTPESSDSIATGDTVTDSTQDYSSPCGAFQMAGSSSIVFFENKNGDSPEVNITSNGAMYGNDPVVYLKGGVANLAHGKFSVHAHNLNSYTTPGNGGLIRFDNTMQINVQSGGDFNVDVADKNNDSTKPINLIYAVTLNLSIMNPKNVSLDLRNDNCKNSALVYIYNSTPQTIHAYDTRISALGNSEPVSGSNIPGTLGNTNGGKDVSLGMEKPLRVQTLELPFIYSAINANMYLNNTAKIQAPGATLDELKGDMAEMQGKEFRYVHLSDLPGPVISSIPHLSRPSTRKITGNVTGDQWQNINDSASPKGEEFSPKPPLIRVQLQHHNETTGLDEITDLGTVVNNKEAYQKENSDPQDINKVPVSPNKLKSSSLDVDDKNIGQPINNDSDEPKYLNSEKGDITWSDSHNFSYDLDTLLTNYNKNHPNSTLSLKPNDTIKTSAVTNYQETPIQDTRISNLDLEKGDEPTEPFLLDDQVQMPFKYLDTESKAKKLYLSGTIYQLVTDTAGKTTNKVISSFTKKEFDINKPGEWITGYLTLPDATKNSGNYVVEFNGTDDLNNVSSTGKDEDLYWKYQVSPLPKYNGKTVLNDHTTGDTTKPGNIVTNLHYNVTTTFEIANSSNSQNLSNVMFSHYGSDAGITDDDSDYTLTASYSDDKGQTINKPLNSGFQYKKDYSPGDFGISTDNFPAGVKFTITHKILVKKKAKDDTDKLVKIGADQMYSKEGDNKVGTLLSTSNSIGYNSIGSIVLNVSGGINYGTSALPLNKQKTLFMKKPYPIVKIENDTSASQPITLTAQVDGDTSSLNNWLYYRKKRDNTDYSDTLMTNTVTVFHNSIGTNAIQDIVSSWLNPKTGEQVTGPVLNPSSPSSGKYSTKITWNLTNSL